MTEHTAPGRGLSDRHRAMLDFERSWWQLDDPRDETIRAQFGCATDDYYAELNRLIEMPEAMAHDPLVVRRFQRRRARRRRALLDGRSGDTTLTTPQGGANR